MADSADNKVLAAHQRDTNFAAMREASVGITQSEIKRIRCKNESSKGFRQLQ